MGRFQTHTDGARIKAINKIIIENRERRTKCGWNSNWEFLLFVCWFRCGDQDRINLECNCNEKYVWYSFIHCFVAPQTTPISLSAIIWLLGYLLACQSAFFFFADVIFTRSTHSTIRLFFFLSFFIRRQFQTTKIETALAIDLISLNNFHFYFHCHLFRLWTELYGKNGSNTYHIEIHVANLNWSWRMRTLRGRHLLIFNFICVACWNRFHFRFSFIYYYNRMHWVSSVLIRLFRSGHIIWTKSIFFHSFQHWNLMDRKCC